MHSCDAHNFLWRRQSTRGEREREVTLPIHTGVAGLRATKKDGNIFTIRKQKKERKKKKKTQRQRLSRVNVMSCRSSEEARYLLSKSTQETPLPWPTTVSSTCCVLGPSYRCMRVKKVLHASTKRLETCSGPPCTVASLAFHTLDPSHQAAIDWNTLLSTRGLRTMNEPPSQRERESGVMEEAEIWSLSLTF